MKALLFFADWRGQMKKALTHRLGLALLTGLLVMPVCAKDGDWTMGVYAGQYHNQEPASFLAGRSEFKNHYILAVTASKRLWRAENWPLELELDAMLGQQWGQATLSEVAVAPVLRWSGLPGRDTLAVDVRAGPLGISYTNIISPLERGVNDQGSRTLNFLMLELTATAPKNPKSEWFARLHHRCTIYDLMNNYGANGEDFFALGWRRRF